MDPFIHAFYSLSYLFLFLWGIKLAREYGFLSIKNVLLLVTFGLIYDNSMLAFGNSIGKGPFPKDLNLLRYWFHALFTPTLILFSWAAAKEAKIRWLDGQSAVFIAALFTAVLIVIELSQNTIGIVLEPVRKYGVLSYDSVAFQGPPIMIIGVSVALLLAGMIIWKRMKWKWMAIGVIIMGIGSMVPIPIASDAATNGFELILLISLWATKAFFDKRTK